MKRSTLLLGAIAVAAVAYSCDGSEPEPNRAPEALGSIPAQEVAATDTARLDVSPYFEDPDGDELRYSAISYEQEVATVSVAGSILSIAAKKRGRAVLLVNAIDPDGLRVSQDTDVNVVGKPGFLRVELTYDEDDVGAVLLMIESELAVDSVRPAAGLEAYHAPVTGGVRAFVAGDIPKEGMLFRFWAEDATAPGDYRGRLEEAAGKDYRQRPAGPGAVVIAK